MYNIHCFFEQSGVFKNEFIKLGFSAFDYDLKNDFSCTDYIIDLFHEIDSAFSNFPSIFDNICPGDLIFAFFPCTRFECQISLSFRGCSYQMKNYSDLEKLSYSLNLHHELSDFYDILCKLCIVCLRRNIKLIIENPYTQPHYLTSYFPLKPIIIDYDRRLNGDYFKKPTQYFFLNFQPSYNLVFESITYIEPLKIEETHNCVSRSLISSQYANRFIRQYIL